MGLAVVVAAFLERATVSEVYIVPSSFEAFSVSPMQKWSSVSKRRTVPTLSFSNALGAIAGQGSLDEFPQIERGQGYDFWAGTCNWGNE